MTSEILVFRNYGSVIPQQRVYKVSESRPQSRNIGMSVSNIVFASCLFLVLLCKVSIRVGILDAGYQIESIRQEMIATDALLREIKTEQAFDLSHQRVASLASEKLDMRMTKPQQLREISVQ